MTLPVSSTLTGLAVGKTYHYRCNGTSSAGTTHGSDATFLTAQAPTVTTVAASSITGSGAKLNGKVNPNGTVTLWGVTSTVSGGGDQGADPNKLVAITDPLAATSPAAGESFRTVRAARFAEVLRDVSFAPRLAR